MGPEAVDRPDGNEPEANDPPGSGTGQHRPAAHWAVSLCEPLVETAVRAEIEASLLRIARAEPMWMAAWLGGQVTDLLWTLPSDDPFRLLSARYAFSSNRAQTFGPATATATPDQDPDQRAWVESPRGRFGTARDHEDLIFPDNTDLDLDVGLAGAHRQLSDEAAVLMAAARHGWRTATVFLANLFGELTAAGPGQTAQMPGGYDTAAQTLLWAGSDAVKSALHRRRVYVGVDEPYFLLTSYRWMSRADTVARWLPGAVDLARLGEGDLAGIDKQGDWAPDPEAQVDPDAYREFRITRA